MSSRHSVNSPQIFNKLTTTSKLGKIDGRLAYLQIALQAQRTFSREKIFPGTLNGIKTRIPRIVCEEEPNELK